MPNRDKRLAELAAIAQLFGSVSGPQVRQQEGQQQNALAILGLLMQQQHQQGQEKEHALDRAVTERGQVAQDAQQAELLKYHQDTLAQGAKQFDAQKEADWQKQMALITQNAANVGIENTWKQKEFELKQQEAKDLLARANVAGYVQLPGATAEGLGRMTKASGFPGADVLDKENADAITNKHVSNLLAEFAGPYAQYPKDPKTAQAGMNAIWMDPRMQSPDVQTAIAPKLSAMDAALAQPTVAPKPPGSGVSEAGMATGRNINHLLYGTLDTPAYVYNHTAVPALNFLGGMAGIQPKVPEAEGLTAVLKRLGFLTPQNSGF